MNGRALGPLVGRDGEGELRLILWAAWDPIGTVPRNEHDAYAPRIWSMLRERRSRVEIASLLGEVRTDHMGLPADEARDLAVAQKLREWIEPRRPSPFRPPDLFD